MPESESTRAGQLHNLARRLRDLLNDVEDAGGRIVPCMDGDPDLFTVMADDLGWDGVWPVAWQPEASRWDIVIDNEVRS